MENNRKSFYLLGVLAIAVLYVAVRLWRLTDSCLWFDEIFGVHAALYPWSEMFWFLAQDLIHPPLFYVFLKIWILAGGESLLWLRLFSVFWETLAIFPLVLLCRELKFSSRETFTALIFLAVNGLLVKYAQEVRMYGMLFCIAIFSIWLLARFLNRNEKTTFLWLFIVNLLLVYTHYFGWLVVGSELLAIFIWKRERIWQFLLGILFLALSFAPWAWAVASAARMNSGLAQNIGWQSKPTLRALLTLVFSLHEPFYYQQSNLDAPNLIYIALPFALVCIGAIVFAFINKDNFSARLLLVFALTPLVVAFAGSWLFPYSIWGIRHLIVIFAPYALLAALGLNRLRPQMLKISAYVLLCTLVVLGCVLHFRRPAPTYIWCGW